MSSPTPRPQCEKKNCSIWELDWFFSWDPQFSSICSVFKPKKLGYTGNPFEKWWSVRYMMTIQSNFSPWKLFARKLVEKRRWAVIPSSLIHEEEKITLSDKSRENGLLTRLSSTRWPKQLYYRIFPISKATRADLDNEHNEYNRNSSLPDFQNPKIETLKFLENFHLILVQFMIVLEIGENVRQFSWSTK